MSLFCQNCGHEHAAYIYICPRCTQRPTPPSSNEAASARLADEELRGVGGWLLFFCISLTIISPIMHVIIAAQALNNLARARVPIETLLRLGLVGAIYSGLAVFSCFAGVMLWMEKPRAVSVAKAYLLVGAVLPIFLFLALHLAGIQVHLSRVIFRRIVSSAVWYSYLEASRRVKITYGLPSHRSPI